MEVNKFSKPVGNELFYNSDFRIVLEDHLAYIKNHSENIVLSIESHYAYKYEGDLCGLLSHYGISPDMHWIIMRVNNFTSPTQIKDTLSLLIIPNKTVISRILSVYRTRTTILS